MLPTTWLRRCTRLDIDKRLPSQAGVIDLWEGTSSLHPLLVFVQNVLERGIYQLRASYELDLKTYLLLEDYVLALPVLHHSQGLKGAHNVI